MIERKKIALEHLTMKEKIFCSRLKMNSKAFLWRNYAHKWSSLQIRIFFFRETARLSSFHIGIKAIHSSFSLYDWLWKKHIFCYEKLHYKTDDTQLVLTESLRYLFNSNFFPKDSYIYLDKKYILLRCRDRSTRWV